MLTHRAPCPSPTVSPLINTSLWCGPAVTLITDSDGLDSLQHIPAMQETWLRSWVGKTLWRRERQPTPVFSPAQSIGSQRVGHAWATNTFDLGRFASGFPPCADLHPLTSPQYRVPTIPCGTECYWCPENPVSAALLKKFQ